jgi:YfiH family protein
VLTELTRPSHAVILQSDLLMRAGFVHAFSTRLGGVSAAPFDALNLQSMQANARIAAPQARDNDAAIRENHARFALAAGLARDATVADVSQVHGCAVITASEALRERTAADAITSARGGHAVLIRIADCVPILIACSKTGSIAAVHAGWRGVVAGVVPAAFAELAKLGVDPRDAIAVIGPCIRAPHFEIGNEVADALASVNLASSIIAPGVHGPKHHADLVHAVMLQLTRVGVDAHNIDADPPCTYADARRFYSFRRDGSASGRLAALIAPRAL